MTSHKRDRSAHDESQVHIVLESPAHGDAAPRRGRAPRSRVASQLLEHGDESDD